MSSTSEPAAALGFFRALNGADELRNEEDGGGLGSLASPSLMWKLLAISRILGSAQLSFNYQRAPNSRNREKKELQRETLWVRVIE